MQNDLIGAGVEVAHAPVAKQVASVHSTLQPTNQCESGARLVDITTKHMPRNKQLLPYTNMQSVKQDISAKKENEHVPLVYMHACLTTTYIHCGVGLDVQQHNRLLLVIERFVPHKCANLAVQHLNFQSRLGGVVVRVAEQVVVGLVGRDLESRASVCTNEGN